MSAVGTGNRCGYDPDSPRLLLRRRKGRRRPPVINRCMAKARQFHNAPGVLPALEDPRGERREAVGLVLQSFFYHADLQSLRVGFPVEGGDDGWAGLPREVYDSNICGETGCNVSRVDRAIEMLQAAGYVVLDGQPREEKPDGTWQGRPARRRITHKLLEALGVALEWAIAAKKAYGERREARRVARLHESTKARRRRLRREAIRNPELGRALAVAMGLPEDDDPPGAWPPREDTEPGRPRPPDRPPSRFDQIQRELERAHPDWPPDRVWNEALRRLEGG